jgi:hypothetical protein
MPGCGGRRRCRRLRWQLGDRVAQAAAAQNADMAFRRGPAGVQVDQQRGDLPLAVGMRAAGAGRGDLLHRDQPRQRCGIEVRPLADHGVEHTSLDLRQQGGEGALLGKLRRGMVAGAGKSREVPCQTRQDVRPQAACGGNPGTGVPLARRGVQRRQVRQGVADGGSLSLEGGCRRTMFLGDPGNIARTKPGNGLRTSATRAPPASAGWSRCCWSPAARGGSRYRPGDAADRRCGR